MQVEIAKEMIEKPRDRFGCISMALMFFRQREPDFSLARVPGKDMKSTIPDYLRAVLLLDSKLAPGARCSRNYTFHLFDEFNCSFSGIGHLPTLVLCHSRIRTVGQECIQVAVLKCAKNQSFGFKFHRLLTTF